MNNQMFKFRRGKLGMENYQIWEFFQFKQRIDFFFSISLSDRVVFYTIDKFHNFLFIWVWRRGYLTIDATYIEAIWVYKIDSAQSV